MLNEVGVEGSPSEGGQILPGVAWFQAEVDGWPATPKATSGAPYQVAIV